MYFFDVGDQTLKKIKSRINNNKVNFSIGIEQMDESLKRDLQEKYENLIKSSNKRFNGAFSAYHQCTEQVRTHIHFAHFHFLTGELY